MKKMIRLTETHKTTCDVEVEFPLYSRHDLDTGVMYMRTDADGRKFAIQRIARGDSVEYQFSVEPVSFEKSDPDFLLGRRSYASSKQEFDLALSRAKTFLQQIDGER